MKDTVKRYPSGYLEILAETEKIKFNQLSDTHLGLFLATLCASKPDGRFLELGTGTGLSTSWILHGMDSTSTLKTIDSEESLVQIAKRYLDDDQRVSFVVGKGEDLIVNTEPNSIDFIFADTWPGKYNHLAETLLLLKKGGIITQFNHS
jgi:predicted O-methyltransferase YrrM